ncbi:hypothetical protein [Vibrio sp. B1Z05]|uniref:hypothetical protein n=1 Tax=Vibrio sp. B1Z05 TaxID=2654980 RepID=UPI00128AF75B|nr:hypothetical protein [Vibrio sp. B1Z05]MPW37450.1 hypothetical protein [Vibrio sp. B1Z05]
MTLALSQLVSTGYLESAGNHKSKIYHLKGIEVPTLDNEAGKSITFVASPSVAQLSLFEQASPDLDKKVPDLTPDLPCQGPDFQNESDELLWDELKQIALPISQNTKRNLKVDVEETIKQLCNEAVPHCLKLADLAVLLNMKADTLRKNYLSYMVKTQQLFLAYPTTPNHPAQGYTTKKVQDGNLTT